jgi:hypothetical protein
MSPGSMTLPTMNNWDMTQAMSPYIPPDMNSKYIEIELFLQVIVFISRTPVLKHFKDIKSLVSNRIIL